MKRRCTSAPIPRQRGGKAAHGLTGSVSPASRIAGIRGNRGFTLFEMVIAVSIFALMSVIATTGISQMTRTGEAVAKANKRLSELQFAVVYFTRDWSQVSPRKIRDQYGDEQPNIVLDDESISFTRSGLGNLRGETRSALQRVQYLVVDNQLVRRHWPSLDQAVGELPFQSVLLNDVERIEVVFLDESEESLTSWPVDATVGDPEKPIALVLLIELADMGEITRVLEFPGGVI